MKESQSPHFKETNDIVILEITPEEQHQNYYGERYTCYPPPIFIISVTFLELGYFAYTSMTTDHNYSSGSGTILTESKFIFRSDKRHEFWRFISYMILHAGWFHLGFNLCVQLLFGLSLEMVHGSTRVAFVYFSGVLAGSLGTSIFDPEVYLVGASGGIYALFAAHLANVMLNYSSIQFSLLRLLTIFIIALYDAIFARANNVPESSEVSYVAHSAGALTGLIVGLLVLRNFGQNIYKGYIWWTALGIYSGCTIFAVIFNVINSIPGQHFIQKLLMAVELKN